MKQQKLAITFVITLDIPSISFEKEDMLTFTMIFLIEDASLLKSDHPIE